MILDKHLRLSDAQAVTTTAVSENTISLGTARDIGQGENLYMILTASETFAGGTSVDFQIITSDSDDLSSPEVISSTGAILTADLASGDQHVLRIPPQIGSIGKKYIGARYVVVGTHTAGTVTTDFTLDIQDGMKYYASGFAV